MYRTNKQIRIVKLECRYPLVVVATHHETITDCVERQDMMNSALVTAVRSSIYLYVDASMSLRFKYATLSTLDHLPCFHLPSILISPSY